MVARFAFRQPMRSRLRRFLCVPVGVALLVAPPGASAAPNGFAAQIVIVQGTESDASRELLASLKQRLGKVGRSASIMTVQSDKASVDKALASTVDLVIALGSHATGLALAAHRDVPVISTMVARESAPTPGNAPAFVVLEFPPEVEMDWMHRILPEVRRVGVMFSSDDNEKLVARAQNAARPLGMEIIARRISDPREIPAALASLTGSADVLWGLADDVALTPETAKAVLLASLRNRIPFVGLSAPWVRSGALYALDRDYTDLGVQLADVAVHMLDGASAKSIGTVHPRRVRYSLNARSASLMKLRFPAAIQRGAVEVVQ